MLMIIVDRFHLILITHLCQSVTAPAAGWPVYQKPIGIWLNWITISYYQDLSQCFASAIDTRNIPLRAMYDSKNAVSLYQQVSDSPQAFEK